MRSAVSTATRSTDGSTDMKRLNAALAAALVAIQLACAAVTAAPAVEAAPLELTTDDAVDLLDLWIGEQMEYRRWPGLAIGVVRGDELLWSRGYGLADLDRRRSLTPVTLFRVGSLTKLVTATAVLRLRDAGRLRLSDPVSRHIPEFEVGASIPDVPAITLAHLLTHTSGLPREAPFPYWTTHEFPAMSEILAALPGQAASFVAGEKIKYSNLGMALLGEVVSRVSGRPYAEYVREEILLPLGMESSTVRPDAAAVGRLATGYMRRLPDGSRRAHSYYDTSGMAAAANLVSNVEDLARFAALQLAVEGRTDEAVLRPLTVEEMHRPHAVDEDWNGGRGLGFGIGRDDGTTLVSHGGWIGGHRAHLLLSPEEEIGVVVLTNAADVNPAFVGRRAHRLIAAAVGDAEAGREPRSISSDRGWERYLGTYSDPWGWEYEVLVLAGELVMYEHSYPPADDPMTGIARLEPVEAHEFRLPDGEPVVFELDDGGEVERVRRRYEFLSPVDDPGAEPGSWKVRERSNRGSGG